MKRITRKQAEALVKKKWGEIGTDELEKEVFALCLNIPIELGEAFRHYWEQINTENKLYISWYEPYMSCKEYDFLRLLTVHLFIRHTYKDQRYEI